MNSGLFLTYAAQLSVVPLHAAAVWQANPAQLGVMFSVVSLMGLIGAPAGGWAADRWGRKWSIIPAACLAVTGLACLPFAADRGMFLGAMALLGLGTSFLTPGLTAFAADVAPPGQRAQALSVGRQAGDIMFTTAPLALGVFADMCGNGMALGVTSGMALCLTAVFGWRATSGALAAANATAVANAADAAANPNTAAAAHAAAAAAADASTVATTAPQGEKQQRKQV